MVPHADITTLQAVCAEIILTFFLVMSIQGVSDKVERHHRNPLPGFVVGCMVAVNVMTGVSVILIYNFYLALSLGARYREIDEQEVLEGKMLCSTTCGYLL